MLEVQGSNLVVSLVVIFFIAIIFQTFVNFLHP